MYGLLESSGHLKYVRNWNINDRAFLSSPTTKIHRIFATLSKIQSAVKLWNPLTVSVPCLWNYLVRATLYLYLLGQMCLTRLYSFLNVLNFKINVTLIHAYCFNFFLFDLFPVYNLLTFLHHAIYFPIYGKQTDILIWFFVEIVTFKHANTLQIQFQILLTPFGGIRHWRFNRACRYGG